MSTSRDRGDKKFSVERFLFISSRLSSIEPFTHAHSKMSLMVVDIDLGEFYTLLT